MIDVPDSIVDDFVKTCHDAAGRGLVLCSSGNLSFRLDEARFIAAATASASNWSERMCIGFSS